MKFTTTAGDFSAAVAAVMPAVGRNMPILENVLIDCAEDTLTITSNNLEISLSANTTVESDDSASSLRYTTVNAQKLKAILAGLPKDQEVVFTSDGDCSMLKSGRSKYKLASLPYDDFPLPDSEDGESFTIESSDLKRVIGDAMHAMADNDVRFYLNGMYFVAMLNGLSVIATDGHRLSKAWCACEGNDMHAIVPHKSVKILHKLLDNGPVTVAISKSQIRATIGNVSFNSKLIDGKFPDWERVVPDKGNGYKVIGDELADMVRRVQVLSNYKYKGVRFDVSAKTLMMTANNPEQESATDEMDIDNNGDEVSKGYSAEYLIDVLTGQGEVDISHAGNSMRVDRDNFTGVVMEMRL